MRVASMWADKYVEQGMSQIAAKSTAYLLLLLVFGSAVAAVAVGIYLLAGGEDSVPSSRGYGLASIVLGIGMTASVVLWPRIRREPSWLPWTAVGSLAVAAAASVVGLVYGLVACVVLVVLLVALLARLGGH